MTECDVFVGGTCTCLEQRGLMNEHPVSRQRPQLIGEKVMACDLCGRLIARSVLELVERPSRSSESESPYDDVWVCPDCLRALEAGEGTADIEYTDEIVAIPPTPALEPTRPGRGRRYRGPLCRALV